MTRQSHAQMLAESNGRTTTATCDYVQYPVRVSRRWREGLIEAFPVLENHENSLFYCRMVEYILYSSFREEESGRLVVPAAVLSKLAGKAPDAFGFRAIDYLEAFSANVWPLVIHDYKPMQEARTVECDVPDAIIALQDKCDLSDDQVWLVSGLPLSPTSRRKHAARYWENIGYLTEGIDADHPAAELAEWLNGQSQTTLGKVVRSNYHRVEALYELLPETTELESAWKRVVRHTLDLTWDQCKLIYACGEKTARITAKGLSLHLLPRGMRKAALAGCYELDIRSSQLAIVARLWQLPQNSDFLASGASIWDELTNYLSLDKSAKPALKDAVYATCFGMGKTKTVERLSKGHGTTPGIGADKAKQFMAHPLIREVLAGRSRRLRKIHDDGGICDAFGCWIEFGRDRPLHSLLAVEAQSWELRLMMSVWEILRDASGVHLLSWLHDGIVVSLEDKREGRVDRLMRVCKEAFDVRAADLGFVTELEQVAL